MSNALKSFAANQKAAKVSSPQTVRTPGRSDEVKNNAGGYVFEVSDRDRLERFLILGTDGGTFYVGQQKFTEQNIAFVREMVRKNESLVRETAVDVSVNARALRNSPALFVMALLMTDGTDKAATREAVQKVARTSTHLFEFAQYIENLGGWGRAKRKAVAEFYQSKDKDSLAYQAVKYRQRNGWTHRDLFRLSHPEGVDSHVGDFILGKKAAISDDVPSIINAFKTVQAAGDVKEVLRVLEAEKRLPWEAIPTDYLKEVKVWKTLFYNGQLNGQALVRNVLRLAKIGTFSDLKFAGDYAARLTDEAMIAKTRLHPINFLNALVVYTEGQVQRNPQDIYGWYAQRNKTWDTSGMIVDALNEGFHLAFKHVEPAGKRTLIGQDVSGSMSCLANGLDLSCSQVGAAVAMQIARTEPYYEVRGFSTQFRDLGISPKDNLANTLRKVSNQTFGGTDCALPMEWALKNRVEIDTFVVITDNETWSGHQKPFQALKKYRDAMGIPARLAVLGVAATSFTIADPSDKGMMDFVGFDSSAPKVLADFSAGRI